MPRTSVPTQQNLLTTTNLLSGWTGTALTSKNAVADPFGGTNAYRLIANGTTALHYASITPTYVIGKRYTFSFYVKTGGTTNGAFMSTGAPLNAPFTINDNTKDALSGIKYSPSGETFTTGQVSWTKELILNGSRTGWKRCFVSWIETASTTLRIGPANDANGETFPGNASTTYIDVYCPQLNEGFGEFEPCPTSGSAVNTGPMRESVTVWRNDLYSSEDLSNNTYWISPNTTRSPNFANDARGERRATKVIPTAGAGSKYVTGNQVSQTSATGETAYGMIEIGYSDFPYVAISFDGGSNVMWVNLTNNTNGTLNGYNSVITDLGNGWRQIKFNRTMALAAGLAIWPADANGSITGTGDGTKYMLIGRTQYNVGGDYGYIRTTTPVLFRPRTAAGTRTATNQNQNLVNQSNQIDLWAPQDITSVTKNLVCPLGLTNNAWTVIANTNSAAGHYLLLPAAVSTNSPCTRSIFVKKTGSWDWMWMWSGAVGYSYFNMATGSFGTNLHGLTSQNYGNGWYRILVPVDYANPPAVVGVTNANNVTAVAGDGTVNTSIGLCTYQVNNANWEGTPVDTGGTAILPGIRDKVL